MDWALFQCLTNGPSRSFSYQNRFWTSTVLNWGTSLSLIHSWRQIFEVESRQRIRARDLSPSSDLNCATIWLWSTTSDLMRMWLMNDQSLEALAISRLFSLFKATVGNQRCMSSPFQMLYFGFFSRFPLIIFLSSCLVSWILCERAGERAVPVWMFSVDSDELIDAVRLHSLSDESLYPLKWKK